MSKNVPSSDSPPRVRKKSGKMWIMWVLTGLYLISPWDLIPDVPVVGWVDDSVLLLLTTLTQIWQSRRGRGSRRDKAKAEVPTDVETTRK